MFDVSFLEVLRRAELADIARHLPLSGRLLEFGAGTGEQARMLAARGFDVTAIDLAGSGYKDHRVSPVIDYDGAHIPLGDGSIDVIFSSNVLEHVEQLPVILSEFRRILAPGGIAIHAMPTPGWRLWTLAAGPPTALVAILSAIARLTGVRRGPARWPAARRDLRTAAAAMLPLGHGTAAEGFSELWTFAPAAWKRRFAEAGFAVIDDRPVGLFHTGHMLLGARLAVAARRRLARVLGSAAHVYVVMPADGAGAISSG